jgi:hypothetical protein
VLSGHVAHSVIERMAWVAVHMVPHGSKGLEPEPLVNRQGSDLSWCQDDPTILGDVPAATTNVRL